MCVVILSVLSTLHQEARMSAGILGTEQSKSENQSEMLSNKTWALGRRLKVRSSPLDGGGAGGGGGWGGGGYCFTRNDWPPKNWVANSLLFRNALSFLHKIEIENKAELLHYCSGAGAILKSNAIPNFLTKDYIHFVSNTLCYTHCCHSPWLRTGHTFTTILSAFYTPLWNLNNTFERIRF